MDDDHKIKPFSINFLKQDRVCKKVVVVKVNEYIFD